MNNRFKLVTLATAVASVLAGANAQAQNPGFAFGDLILGFQTTGTGNGSFVLANLGAATTLRDTVGNISLINVNSALAAQFGATWYDRTDLFVGAATVWDADAFNDALNVGDPTYTQYISAPRTAAGVSGVPQSTGYSQNEAATTGSGDFIIGTANDFETRGGGAISTLTNAGSSIDWVDQNPTTGVVQGTAFGFYSSGIQAAFGLGTFGNLGGIQAEAALDLYRIQYRNDIVGQYGFGQPNNQGGYEGSIVIAQDGQVSLINVVPEPTSLALLGLSAGFVGMIRRRTKVA